MRERNEPSNPTTPQALLASQAAFLKEPYSAALVVAIIEVHAFLPLFPSTPSPFLTVSFWYDLYALLTIALTLIILNACF